MRKGPLSMRVEKVGSHWPFCNEKGCFFLFRKVGRKGVSKEVEAKEEKSPFVRWDSTVIEISTFVSNKAWFGSCLAKAKSSKSSGPWFSQQSSWCNETYISWCFVLIHICASAL